MELREFIEQRISDDERVALAAPPSPWEADGDGISSAGTSLVSGMHTDGFMDELAAVHAARHDPARVLREVEAKRRLLAQYQAVCDEVRSPKSAEHRMNARARQFALDEVLVTLAAPYSDHPDYRQEWAT